eukprot:m.301143 g.301143  ORF g.301143 m.301143 type:complete len:433 (-) comp14660_c0_seq1:193-1491(-)
MRGLVRVQQAVSAALRPGKVRPQRALGTSRAARMSSESDDARDGVVVSHNSKCVTVRWPDRHLSHFHNIWLHDHCPQSLHPTSRQRPFDTVDIPADIEPDSLQLSADGQLTIHWRNSPLRSTSTFDLDWLRANCYSREERTRRRTDPDALRPLPWGAEIVDEIDAGVLTVSSEALLAGDSQALRTAFEAIVRRGVAIVKDCPLQPEACAPLFNCFGLMRRTFYADGVWDTKPKAATDVNDLAYTNVELKPHTDASYFLDPPGLQLFNCVEQSSAGGRTWLVDGFRVAQSLKASNPLAYNFFAATSLPYRCIESGVSVLSHGPTFEEDAYGHLHGFRFNESDRSVLRDLSHEQIEAFYKFLPELTQTIQSDENSLKLRLDVGTMVVINNRRVMHGRESFQGQRNLVGCYIAQDDWVSRARVLGIVDELLPCIL